MTGDPNEIPWYEQAYDDSVGNRTPFLPGGYPPDTGGEPMGAIIHTEPILPLTAGMRQGGIFEDTYVGADGCLYTTIRVRGMGTVT